MQEGRIVLGRRQAKGMVQGLGQRQCFLAALHGLRWIAQGKSPSTTDEYVRSFHEEPHEHMSTRPVLGRVLASIATIGYGGALGL